MNEDFVLNPSSTLCPGEQEFTLQSRPESAVPALLAGARTPGAMASLTPCVPRTHPGSGAQGRHLEPESRSGAGGETCCGRATEGLGGRQQPGGRSNGWAGGSMPLRY